MNDTINVDFELLETDIDKLKALKKRLKKPKISVKMDLVKQGGKGDVHSNIHSFTSSTVDYYKVVCLLIDNTISYLEGAKIALEDADKTAANGIKKEV